MVVGRDSRGRGFESQHQRLDGHYIVEKLKCLFEKTENKLKIGCGWPIC